MVSLWSGNVMAQAAAPVAAPVDTPVAENIAPGVTRYGEVAYQSLSGYHPQQADLYVPTAGAASYPAVVYVHGGGWGVGSSRMSGLSQTLTALAARGYVVMAINYRFYGEAKFPAQIQDTKAAIRWLRSNAAAYKVDTNKIAIWGESAGGYLAALAGTSCNAAALEPPKPAGGAAMPGQTQIKVDANQSSCVQAVVDYYGPTEFAAMDGQLTVANARKHNGTDSAESQLLGCALTQCAKSLLQQSNPLTYVDGNEPPFLIVHGDKDTAVPLGQSEMLAAALKAKKVTVTFKTVSGADHMFNGASAAQKQDITDTVYAFLDKTLKGR
ncbi:MAG: alpha/beta hydrolase [Steroidobacteraceae bacterium]